MEQHVLSDGTIVTDYRTLNLGELLRVERENANISIRELSRRSNVSAGQISRIESGQTARPSGDTLVALARGLGGDPLPLLVLAGHRDAAELERVEERIAGVSDVAAEISDWVYDASDEPPESRAVVLFAASRAVGHDVWLKGADFDKQAAQEMSEIAGAWPALTPERRKLVRAFVADQEVLSTLDRLPATRGRYEITIDLEPADQGEASDD